MVDLQNATLAGGVAIGAVGDFNIDLWGALVIGGLAGIISVLGYVYVMHFLEDKWGICDTCGVHNLHGMPGILGAFASVIGATVASRDEYGKDGLGAVFPKIDGKLRVIGREWITVYGLSNYLFLVHGRWIPKRRRTRSFSTYWADHHSWNRHCRRTLHGIPHGTASISQ